MVGLTAEGSEVKQGQTVSPTIGRGERGAHAQAALRAPLPDSDI